MLTFECLRCASCCRDLITPLKIGPQLEVHQGLCLFEEETSFFPSSKILPMHGYGNDPYDVKFKVVTFQFTESSCPHLRNHDCSIRDRRPISCQAYPFSPNPKVTETTSYWVDPSCSWTKKHVPNDGKSRKIHAPEENFALSQILSRLSLMRKTFEGMFWMFDVSKKEWFLGI